MFEKFTRWMGAAEKVVEEPQTAEQHAMKTAMLLIHVFITDESNFAKGLRATVEALMSDDDPLIQDMSFADKMMLRSLLFTFRAERKKYLARIEKEAAKRNQEGGGES